MQKQSPLLSVLNKATQLLVLLAAGLVLMIVYSFFVPQETALIAVNTDDALEEDLPDVKPAVPVPGDFEADRALFESRDIFAVPHEKKIITPVQTMPTPEPSKTPEFDLSQEFNLVGIVIDADRPQAVVERIQDRETIFLTVGDKLGEATLKEILPDRIIFRSGGNEIKLVPRN